MPQWRHEEGREGVPRRAWAWSQLGRMRAFRGMWVHEAGCNASDILQESGLPRELHMQHFTMVCSTEGWLPSGCSTALLSTRASWVSCTGCLLVASGGLHRLQCSLTSCSPSQPSSWSLQRRLWSTAARKDSIRAQGLEELGSSDGSWRRQCHCCQRARAGASVGPASPLPVDQLRKRSRKVGTRQLRCSPEASICMLPSWGGAVAAVMQASPA